MAVSQVSQSYRLDVEAEKNPEYGLITSSSVQWPLYPGPLPFSPGSHLLPRLCPANPVAQVMVFCPRPSGTIQARQWPTRAARLERQSPLAPKSGSAREQSVPSAAGPTSSQSWRWLPGERGWKLGSLRLRRPLFSAAETCPSSGGGFAGRLQTSAVELQGWGCTPAAGLQNQKWDIWRTLSLSLAVFFLLSL